ncbi:vacuolar carboxypeptidase-like protein Cps1 [Westerdykella ornata]|uniref:Vacuolar carboxypeptidase-like protein Cps1 n=1 Tax=Westerdykella ornata TaxID=318751 RepID=A0A6A6JKV3_WESOR|nr:vacuolar carboxypeptidase-like protein Cps1 [Westerdykella ornata]KAF2276894.1 vacuolar carboxypeptidase-like protein Cps1 [Westerdykella ornata]
MDKKLEEQPVLDAPRDRKRGVKLPTFRAPWKWTTGKLRHGTGTREPRCPQVEPLYPKRRTKALDAMDKFLNSDDFRNATIPRLSGAVQIPTESFDDMGNVGEDPRWDAFYPFAAYLNKRFPLVHSTLQLDKINTHALLYTWPGTNPSLKPTLLMAHQDVVPVPKATEKQWTHPPFSGFYDGTFIWGRGSSDCKNQLIGIMEAVEALIEAGFTPKRTLILSFGFDEEISGLRGAQRLSRHLVEKYGHNSMAVIVDEGAVIAESWGANFAMPGVAEKGAVDIDIVVRMPGGHSSIPPPHNGIGVASELITLIEANPYEPFLDDKNPYLSLLRCGAEHAPHFPKKLRHLLDQRDRTCRKKHDPLAQEASKAGLDIKYLMTTSVAVDLISGGVKTNALPERTQFTVNHRINVGSSSSAVFAHITDLAAHVARKYNLTLTPFNGTESPSSITLSYRPTLLQPAPVTPTLIDPKRPSAYSILAGTTRALYAEDGILVAPGIMTGNTDTRYYWVLSENIFRYAPGWDKEQRGLGNIHTVDERIGVQAHVDTVRWMVGFVRNMDEAELE